MEIIKRLLLKQRKNADFPGFVPVLFFVKVLGSFADKRYYKTAKVFELSKNKTLHRWIRQQKKAINLSVGWDMEKSSRFEINKWLGKENWHR